MESNLEMIMVFLGILTLLKLRERGKVNAEKAADDKYKPLRGAYVIYALIQNSIFIAIIFYLVIEVFLT